MARTTIKIVGISERKTGVSPKNNQPYDFFQVSFVYRYPTFKGFQGFMAATSNISGDMIDAIGGIKLDDERDIFFHTFNNKVIVDGIL